MTAKEAVTALQRDLEDWESKVQYYRWKETCTKSELLNKLDQLLNMVKDLKNIIG